MYCYDSLPSLLCDDEPVCEEVDMVGHFPLGDTLHKAAALHVVQHALTHDVPALRHHRDFLYQQVQL